MFNYKKVALLETICLLIFTELLAWVQLQYSLGVQASKRPGEEAPMRTRESGGGGEVTAAKLLTRLGYDARDFEFTTRDGYILNIVRATNPLFAAATNASSVHLLYPLLFVHGSLMSASSMLGATRGSRPRDFRKKLSASGVSSRETTASSGKQQEEEAEYQRTINEVISEDPSRASLPLLALNFGYEIWLLNRRGSEKSSKSLDSTTATAPAPAKQRTLIDALIALPEVLGFSRSSWAPPGGILETLIKESGELSSGKYPFFAAVLDQISSYAGLPEALKLSDENFISKPLRRKLIQTLNPKYWSHSLDEQVAHDLPQAVDFVLAQTNKTRVHAVGHSSGGALILLAASEAHLKLDEKVASASLWSPMLNMDEMSADMKFLIPLVSDRSYLGPVPPVFIRSKLVNFLKFVCTHELAQRTICARGLDFFLGFSSLEAPVTPSILVTALQPTSTRELSHLFQFARSQSSRPCKFNFGSEEENIRAYGQRAPPCYDLSQVNLTNLSIYTGAQDALVTPEAIKRTAKQLKVEHKVTIIDGAGVHFNHAGALLHDDAASLLVVPTLLGIERVERARSLSSARKNDNNSSTTGDGGGGGDNEGSCLLGGTSGDRKHLYAKESQSCRPGPNSD